MARKKKSAKVITPYRIANFEERFASTDDLMNEILATNDRLNNGEITPDHARTLVKAFEGAVRLIDAELSAARHMGKMGKTVERWLKRVAASPKDAQSGESLIKGLKHLLAQTPKRKRTHRQAREVN